MGQYRHLGLSEDEQRALIFIRETGRITNSDYRDLNRVDTLAASQRLVHLRDLGLIEQVPRGAATYYVPRDQLGGLSDENENDLFSALSQESEGLSHKSGGLSHKSETDKASADYREQLLAELPKKIRAELDQVGQRSRNPKQIPELILAICALRPYGTLDLAVLLGRRRDYLRRCHIVPLLEQGDLQFRYPDEPNRPDQAYIATKDPS